MKKNFGCEALQFQQHSPQSTASLPANSYLFDLCVLRGNNQNEVYGK